MIDVIYVPRPEVGDEKRVPPCPGNMSITITIGGLK